MQEIPSSDAPSDGRPPAETTAHGIIPEPARFRGPDYLAVLDEKPDTRVCAATTVADKAMRASAERCYPHEACGLLIGRADSAGWRIDEAFEVRNLNTERAGDRFILDPEAYQSVDKSLAGSGREIIGVYHSHPDCPAKPSPTDLAAAWEGFAYIIISTCRGKAADTRCWALNDAGDKFMAVEIETLKDSRANAD